MQAEQLVQLLFKLSLSALNAKNKRLSPPPEDNLLQRHPLEAGSEDALPRGSLSQGVQNLPPR